MVLVFIRICPSLGLSQCRSVANWFHLSVSPSVPSGWLAGPEAWLAGPEAWLAGPEAWLDEPEAWLGLRPGWLVFGPAKGEGGMDERANGLTNG